MRIRRAMLLSLAVLLMSWGVIEANENLESRDPISILSDADFTVGNGVRSGSGTIEDPYIISGWQIDAEQGRNCIRIENVSSVFRIEHCLLVGASAYAVELVSTARAEIIRSCISSSLFGVLLELCEQSYVYGCSFNEIGWTAVTLVESISCQVAECLFVESKLGIVLREYSTGNKLVDNVFLSKLGTGIRIEAQCGGNLIVRNDFHVAWCYSDSYNRWSNSEGDGNYWSRYRGNDQDGDGIGDTHAIMLGGTREVDQHPAMALYHPDAETEWYLCRSKE